MKNFAVIGIGRMGGVHARNIVSGKVAGANLIAVCDLDAVKLTKFKEKHPKVHTYGTHQELFANEKLDAVIVATPHYDHIPLVCYAIEHGVNVISEKPQSVAISMAKEGIAVADQHKDVKYGIMFNQRTNRMYAKAKEIIESGRLGNIKRVTLTITDWYRSQYYYSMGGWRASWWGEGGGLLINQCVHQLDVLQWLIGMPNAITAYAETRCRDITVENDVVAVMEYDGGYKCVFTANGHEIKGTNNLEIAGDKGKITIGKKKMTFIEFNKTETEVNATTKRGYGNTSFKVHKYSYGVVQKLKEIILGGQQANVLRIFTRALEGKGEMIADGREGINALSIINGIYLSSYTGNKKVSLPLDAAAYDAVLAENKEKEKIILAKK
ncbi:MAG: Gfo/Idh/MocA family oxidoreductase [Bacillota bacterium]